MSALDRPEDADVATAAAFVRSSRGVRIHYVSSTVEPTSGTPVLVVPGMGESAEEYEDLVTALAPRRAAAVSVRGRGQSEAPASGYRFEDHVDDLDAVVSDLGWGEFSAVAFSRGTSYGLGMALRHPTRVRAVVVGDYWARHVGLPPAFNEAMMARSWRGRSMAERMPEHAARGVQAESEEIPLWARLASLPCPILLVRAGRRSILDDGAVAMWREHVPNLNVVELPEAKHDLWGSAPDEFLDALVGFLDTSGA